MDTFHQQFNDSKFLEIYSTSTPAFKASAKEPDFMKFIQAVHRKLGTVKAATPNGWKVNTFNGVTSVVLTDNTDFEQGSAVNGIKIRPVWDGGTVGRLCKTPLPSRRDGLQIALH